MDFYGDIIKWKFKEALDEVKKRVPKSIPGENMEYEIGPKMKMELLMWMVMFLLDHQEYLRNYL